MIKNNKDVQQVLEEGKAGDFWDTVKQYLKKSIERFEEDQRSADLRELPASEYKVQNEILLAKIDLIKSLLELPDNIIMSLNETGELEKGLDPYAKAKDFIRPS